MQYFRGKWIFKLKRDAVKIAYIQWLVDHKERFDCFLLTCGSFQIAGVKKCTESN